MKQQRLDYNELLKVAIEEAERGRAEGGISIGGALFDWDGKLLGKGPNWSVRNEDSSVHDETDAFRNAGWQHDYRNTILVSTLSPC